jgi:hypothetical protein
VSSGVSGSGFTVNLVKDGSITSLCKVTVPQTGSNTTYKKVTGILGKYLQEGRQTLRFVITGANCNIDKVEFRCILNTGIEQVFNDGSDQSATLYNLQGMKVDATYRGIVIKNGRKMMVL